MPKNFFEKSPEKMGRKFLAENFYCRDLLNASKIITTHCLALKIEPNKQL
jgi:hypothetical protein